MLVLPHRPGSAPATLKTEGGLNVTRNDQLTILGDKSFRWYRHVVDGSWDFGTLEDAIEHAHSMEQGADGGRFISRLETEFNSVTSPSVTALYNESWSVLNTLQREAGLAETLSPGSLGRVRDEKWQMSGLKPLGARLGELEAEVQVIEERDMTIHDEQRVAFVSGCRSLLLALEEARYQVQGLELLRRMNNVLLQYRDILGPLRNCIVCSRGIPTSRFPEKVTAACSHTVNTCLECLANWIASQFAAWGLVRLQCIECYSALASDDIKNIASAETFQKYTELEAKKAYSSMDEFQWCLNPKCESGQLHYGGAKMQCHVCQIQACTKHGVAWHAGETCQKYEQRRKSAIDEDQASEEWKVKTARACPFCEAPIEKNGGCSHMNCWKCNAHFSWDVTVAYDAKSFVWQRDLRKTCFRDKRKRSIPGLLWTMLFRCGKVKNQELKVLPYIEDGC